MESSAEEQSKQIQSLITKGTYSIQEALAWLEHDDPITQEWGTVALRSWRGDPQIAKTALLGFFQKHDREALRCYALESLGRLGFHIPLDWLPDLVAKYQDVPKPRVLGKALYWISWTAQGEESLVAMLELPKTLKVGKAAQAGFWKRYRVSMLRLAKREMVIQHRNKAWFREHDAKWILDELGETRIEEAIKEQIQKKSQQALLPPEEMELVRQDEPLVPGRPLVDDHTSQYSQDVADAETKKNIRIVEKMVYVRDQALAREAKRLAGNRCQVCGEGIPGSGEAQRFIHAHHILSLGEGGQDVIKNLVVLCPTCHSKVHSSSFLLEFGEEKWRLISRFGSRQAQTPLPSATDAIPPSPQENSDDDEGGRDGTRPQVVSSASESTDRGREALQQVLSLIPLLDPSGIAQLRDVLSEWVPEDHSPEQSLHQFEPIPPEVKAEHLRAAPGCDNGGTTEKQPLR